jgi:hypothetical protein
MRTVELLLILSALSAFGRTAAVSPGDQIADTLLTLSQGDTLFLSPGTYTSSLEQPLLTAGPEQSGVIITSQPVNRAVLDGQSIERSVIVLEGPFTSDVVLENLVITGGNATGTGSFSGGGIFAGESKAVVSNCIITNNTALIGGGVGAEGGTLHIQYTTFINNEALVTGGGIDLYACDFSGFLLQFLNNTSSDDGGGMNSYQSTITLTNSLFTGNYSGDDGGAITVLQGTSCFEFLTLNANEAADDGGGMRIHTIDSVSVLSSIITSNIGKGGINVISDIKPCFSHVCCWNNSIDNYHGMTDPTGTDGNISTDPMFTDVHLNLSQTAAGQTADSPCLDSGHTWVDETPAASLSTRTDSIPDTGMADMGFHHINLNQTGISPRTSNTVRLIVSPSPAAAGTEITLVPGLNTPVTIHLYDAAGRLIHTQNGVDLSRGNSWNWTPDMSFPGGLVFILITGPETTVTGKVVVLR